MAIVLLWSGRAEESLPLIDKALADEGSGARDVLLTRKCGACLNLGRYEEAVAACEKSAGLYSCWLTYAYLTAAYAQQGDDAKAMATKQRLMQIWPDFTIARHRLTAASDNPVYWQRNEAHLYAGLRKVGVPEK